MRCFLLLAVATAGCFDGVVGADARVACAGDGDCPDGFVCAAAAGLCVVPGREAPGVVDAAVAPAVARADTLVTLTFTVDRPLLLAPLVRLVGGAAGVDADVSVDDAGVVTARALVDAGLGDGEASFVVDLVAEDGGVRDGVVAGRVIVDTRAPAVVATGVSGLVGAGGEAFAFVTFNEPVASFALNDDELGLVEVSNDGLTLSWRAVIDGHADGLDRFYDVEVNDIVDAAGNVVGGVYLGRVVVDSAAPAVAIVANAAVVSRSQDFGVEVTVEDGATYDVFVGDALVCSDEAACVVDSDAAFAENGEIVVVTAVARDAAGNRGEASTIVRVDGEFPRVVGTPTVVITPPPTSMLARASAASDGATVDLVAVFTEEIERATLSLVDLETGFARDLDVDLDIDGPLVSTSFVVDGTFPEGPLTLAVSGTDRVGLGGGELVQLVVDRSAPVVDEAARDGVVYRRERDAVAAVLAIDVADGSFDAGDTVVAVDASDGVTEVGRAAVGAGGGALVTLRGSERDLVAIVVVDAAGNASAPALPRRVTWDVVPGLTRHSALTSTTALQPALAQPTAAATLPARLTATARFVEVPVSDIGPPGEPCQAVGYDPRRDRVVVYGGAHDGRPPRDDLWEFDGAVWRLIDTGSTSAQRPPALSCAAFGWDPEREVLVLIGGQDARVERDEVWEWDGASFRAAGSGPLGRALVATVGRRLFVLDADGGLWRRSGGALVAVVDDDLAADVASLLVADDDDLVFVDPDARRLARLVDDVWVRETLPAGVSRPSRLFEGTAGDALGHPRRSAVTAGRDAEAGLFVVVEGRVFALDDGALLSTCPVRPRESAVVGGGLLAVSDNRLLRVNAKGCTTVGRADATTPGPGIRPVVVADGAKLMMINQRSADNELIARDSAFAFDGGWVDGLTALPTAILRTVVGTVGGDGKAVVVGTDACDVCIEFAGGEASCTVFPDECTPHSVSFVVDARVAVSVTPPPSLSPQAVAAGPFGVVAYIGSETWLFAGGAWSRVVVDALPGERSGAALVAGFGRVFLFGGAVGDDRVFAYDGGADWSVVDGVTVDLDVVQAVEDDDGPLLFPDDVSGRVLRFTGDAVVDVDVGDSAPPPRLSPALGRVPGRDRVLLHGGGGRSDTWLLDDRLGDAALLAHVDVSAAGVGDARATVVVDVAGDAAVKAWDGNGFVDVASADVGEFVGARGLDVALAGGSVDVDDAHIVFTFVLP